VQLGWMLFKMSLLYFQRLRMTTWWTV